MHVDETYRSFPRKFRHKTTTTVVSLYYVLSCDTYSTYTHTQTHTCILYTHTYKRTLHTHMYTHIAYTHTYCTRSQGLVDKKGDQDPLVPRGGLPCPRAGRPPPALEAGRRSGFGWKRQLLRRTVRQRLGVQSFKEKDLGPARSSIEKWWYVFLKSKLIFFLYNICMNISTRSKKKLQNYHPYYQYRVTLCAPLRTIFEWKVPL